MRRRVHSSSPYMQARYQIIRHMFPPQLIRHDNFKTAPKPFELPDCVLIRKSQCNHTGDPACDSHRDSTVITGVISVSHVDSNVTGSVTLNLNEKCPIGL